MMVETFANGNAGELRMYISVLGMEQGWAQNSHYNSLLNEVELLRIAATIKKDTQLTKLTTILLHHFHSIRQRWEKVNKIGCNADELSAVRMLPSVVLEFWNRQSSALREEALCTLMALREQRESNG